MTHWLRFKHNNQSGFGTLENEIISVHEGNMFDKPTQTDHNLNIGDVQVMTPCTPTKMLALWNNFHATAEKNDLPMPDHPWYFVKTANSFAPAGATIKKPAICSGKILFEGELGIVIGKTCKDIDVDNIDNYIFGYTCINDVTALEYLFKEETFAHWIRSKNFDGFGIFGPTIATDIEPDSLTIKTFLKGDSVQERQNYPVSDMIFSPREIASKISCDMTLEAGDVIACGTASGSGPMRDGQVIEIDIEGVGKLINKMQG